MGLPRRIDVVFRFWPCDKKNHGWREGPPLTVPCQSFDLLPGLRPPVKSVSNETRILLYVAGREPQHNFGRFKTTIQNLSLFLVPVVGVGKNLPQFERRNREQDSIPYRLDQADR